jgi:hypothetical protein
VLSALPYSMHMKNCSYPSTCTSPPPAQEVAEIPPHSPQRVPGIDYCRSATGCQPLQLYATSSSSLRSCLQGSTSRASFLIATLVLVSPLVPRVCQFAQSVQHDPTIAGKSVSSCHRTSENIDTFFFVITVLTFGLLP